ncbi:MAG: DUF2303 family protein [Aquabacterium sp.]|nr:DUF2303 family protein [Aquabacterium sp.]
MSNEDTKENLAQTLTRELPKAEILASRSITGPNDRDLGEHFYVAVPKGFTMQTIDNADLLPGPRRADCSAHLDDVSSFIEYTKRHANPSTVTWCQFNPQSFSLAFVTVVDEHAKDLPGWRDHQAVFTPDMSAEWKTWKGKNDATMKQIAFAEWIEEHADDITAELPDAVGLPSSLQMLTMATEFQYNEERVLKSTARLNSGGVRLTYIADADKGTTEDMKLFERFGLGIPVFHDGAAFPIHCRLKYRTNAGSVSFFYQMIRPDKVHKAAALKLIDTIREAIAPVPMLMGSVPS